MRKRTFIFTLVLTLLVFAVYSAIIRTKAHPMIDKAIAYIESLSDEQKQDGLLSFIDEDRTAFEFFPATMVARRGLSLKALSPHQDILVYDLLKSSLSQEGYLKTEQIIALEEILKMLEGTHHRDVEEYYLSVWGDPAEQGAWGWKFTGHHLSFNFTMVDGEVASTPTFLGANPAEVRSGEKKGLRVLAEEEDLAFDLLHSLSEQNRATAIYQDKAPDEIISEKQTEIEALPITGIPYADMSNRSRKILEELITEYIEIMPAQLAQQRKDKLVSAGWDKIYFAWAGALEKGSGHYYRIQGPTFLVEFDNIQNDANHIHSVWRDFNGDFGRDLLREHYKHAPHHDKH
ncbi:MAG: DUF3500 domain-containing protein [Saprospiraceae bacterium]|nr:DUF3500 domain-containing protein [Saprospiraceae bacterium]